MRREPGRNRSVLAIAALAAIAAGPYAAAKPPEWLGFQTPHFVIYSQVSPRHARRVFGRLQLYIQSLPTLTNLPDRPPTIPTRIFLLEDEEFARVAAGSGKVDGLFWADPFSGSIVINASGRTDSSLSVIQHEYVHFAIRNAGVTALPAFYEEGLAQIMQSFQPFDMSFVWGFFPPGYLRSARSTEMPLSRLLAIRSDSDEYTADHSQERFYARSLLFLHYCLIGNREFFGPMMRTVARLADGEPEVATFTEEFGMSPEAFDARLDAYLAKNAEYLYFENSRLPRKADAELGERALAPGEAEQAYADLLLDVVPHDQGLAALFESQLTVPALRDRALAGLAGVLDLGGGEAAADARLAELAGLPSASAAALVQAGDVLLDRAARQRAADAPGDWSRFDNTMRRARSFYEAALAREPASAEAAFGYGVTQAQVPDDIGTSLKIVHAASAASPGNAELAMLLAVHLQQAGDHEAALRTMRSAVCGAVSPGFRQFARQLLGPVRCYARSTSTPTG